MKLRFNSFDIVCGITELQTLVGSRVNKIYDVDNKTYLIRLQNSGEAKQVLLIESGIRFHTTSFEWPKNTTPSGFSMKLRKHLKNKRLEKIEQLGVDRIVDFHFGMGEASYHVIVELYDRGNIILTDHTMTILYILRPHYEGEDVRFAVREKYPCERAKKESPLPTAHDLVTAIATARPGDSLNRVIMPMVFCGPTVIEHVLTSRNLNQCIVSDINALKKNNEQSTGEEKKNSKRSKNKRDSQQKNTRDFDIEKDINNLNLAIQEISEIMKEARRKISKGFIIQRKEEKPSTQEEIEVEYFYQNIEYHPFDFVQFKGYPVIEFETFMKAVDEFYSTAESQKIDMKTLQQEREVLKKLSNVKKDHAKRIDDLNKLQEGDKQKAELITMNQSLVDNCILAIRSAIANQMSWPEIRELVKAAQANGDPVAGAIKMLKLEINHISLVLSDPYDSNLATKNYFENENIKSSDTVDVDLSLSAWANARKYYDQKRSAAQKEQKTIDASQKALKSAERKTQQTLKDVRAISVISKARKVYWFEKFYWFISSENYLVIGGRDAQQNDIIVKRYMRPTDIYVHAEIQGASSVVVRNPSGADIPPKTLLEAGTMAISYSVAWDAKVITNAYWVRSDQVSKTAPAGEYLATGSFMIRGKKNFLPSCHLIMGVSLLFKLEDSFIESHRGERKVRTFDECQENKQEMQSTTPVKNYCISDTIFEKDEEVEEREVKEKKFRKINRETVTEFPDTQVKVEHDNKPISVKNNLPSKDFFKESKVQKVDRNIKTCEEGHESTIIPAAQTRKKQQQNQRKRKENKDQKLQKSSNQYLQVCQSTQDYQIRINSQAVKRGQKGKLKKIKAKYKNQDEEERQLRMQILNSAGKSNEIVTNSKENEEYAVNESNKVIYAYESKKKELVDLEDADDVLTGADVEMIDSLTGQPYDQDELLFVIPVVAPYQALQNYKYKIKLTPGTGKRGRAAKTALAMFSKDKTSTEREKDLLKSIKEEVLARNIPGKVKLSAPQLQKLQ